jgi:hypothetical protein
MDDDPAVGDPHFFSNFGNATKLLLNQTTDCHSLIAKIDLQEIIDLAHLSSTVNKDVVLP